MTRTTISYCLFLLITTITFCFAACLNTAGDNEKKYCGIVMNTDEILNVNTKQKNYQYSGNDMDLQGEIAYFAQKIGGDSIIIEVFFFLSNEAELGIYLSGPNDPKIIHAMACAIINGKYENKVPPEKYILYYDERTEKLISAIKSPERSKAD